MTCNRRLVKVLLKTGLLQVMDGSCILRLVHNVKVSGEGAGVDENVAKELQKSLKEIEEDCYLPQ